MEAGHEILAGGEGLAYLNSLNPEEGYAFNDYDEFLKAVTTNMGTAAGGTDMALLTGGAAFRLQSIDGTLAETITRDEDFVGFNRLNKKPIGATLHEWTEETDIGGAAGHDFVGETDDIPEYAGTRARKFIEPRFLHTMASVSFAQTRQTATLADAVVRENIACLRRLKRSAEHAVYFGDKAANPYQYDGMLAQILATNDTDLIVDARGNALSYGADEHLAIARAVRGEGRFGVSTTTYMSQSVRTEFNQNLLPALRVGINGSTRARDTELGMIVSGIVGASGNGGVIGIVEAMYLTEGDMPWESRTGNYPSLVTAAGLTAVAACSVAAASSTTSRFEASHAGLYYWGVESYGPKGRSACFVTAQLAVAAGQKSTLTITNPADANVTGFIIHRSRQDGTNAKTDLREMLLIPRQAGASTVWVDDNLRIPGTSPVFVTNERPGDEAIDIVRFFPATQFPLYPTKKPVKPWAVLMSCALRMKKRRQHGVILNVLPKATLQKWRPFNV